MKKIFLLSKSKNGYSLIVLIVVIIVILLLAMVSIASLRSSREKTAATNFIYDLNTVQETVRNYYTSKGTLPTVSDEALSIYEIVDNYSIPKLLSQLSNEDDELYYPIDLKQLQGVALKDTTRGYFVNNGSQKVYVVYPLQYQKSDKGESEEYYTLTPDLVNGEDTYSSVEEDVQILGNPINWATKADIRVVLPKRALSESNWSSWDFRFSIGPRTKEEMEKGEIIRYKSPSELNSGEALDTTKIVKFDYGEMITLRTNGTYTFYIREPDAGGQRGNVTIKNLNINMIDDIRPKYEFLYNGTKFYAVDNETGIKEIRYKTLTNYNENLDKAESGVDEYKDARTNLDYYLIDGKGKDLIYDLKAEITTYIAEKKKINDAIALENTEYERWVADNPLSITVSQEDLDNADARHNAVLNDLNTSMNDLNREYSYLYDIDGTTEDSRLVVCIIDTADNAIVVGESDFLSTRILADSYNVSLEELE